MQGGEGNDAACGGKGEGEAKVVNVLKELKFRGYNKNLILQAARIPQIDDVGLMKQYKKFVENAIF